MGYRNPLTLLGRGITIVGAKFKTAYTGARWEIGGPVNGVQTIAGFSGNAAETSPSTLTVNTGAGGAYSELDVTSGSLNGHATSKLTLRSRDAANSTGVGLAALASIQTDYLEFVTTQGIALFGAGVILPNLAPTGFAAAGLFSGNWTDNGGGRPICEYWIDAMGWCHLRGQTKLLSGTNMIIASGLPRPADSQTHNFTSWAFGNNAMTNLDIVPSGINTASLQMNTAMGAPNTGPSLDTISYQV